MQRPGRRRSPARRPDCPARPARYCWRDAVIAWALPAGVSADASCALALATEAASADGLRIAVGIVGASAFVGRGFRRHLAGLVMRVLSPVVRACLAYLLSAIGARPPSELRSQPSAPAACDGPRETHQEPCCEYQRRAPAGFDGHLAISPFASPRSGNETPRRVRSGAKKGNLRASTGRKRGNGSCADDVGRAVGRENRWNEPCGCQPDRSML